MLLAIRRQIEPNSILRKVKLFSKKSSGMFLLQFIGIEKLNLEVPNKNIGFLGAGGSPDYATFVAVISRVTSDIT